MTMIARPGILRATLLPLLATVALSACEQRIYPLGEGPDPGGSVDAQADRIGFLPPILVGGTSGSGTGAGARDGGTALPDGAVRLADGGVCLPAPEICDGKDQDCDGIADDGIDLMTDEANCGRCGRVCTAPHALPSCEAGACKVGECLPGWFDVDGSPDNGCECLRSNGGVELCDGADNDCDGQIDEDFAFATDLLNCGGCGKICDFPHATPQCSDGLCAMGACDEGRIDLNDKRDDGCEYECTASNGGVEICDGVDNDCDGGIDNDPIDAGMPCGPDVVNTGVCRRGVMTCTSGRLLCLGATEPGIEFCDNNDNDCDGETDEGFDKQSDIRYCGNCVPCAIPFAVPRCNAGQCQLEVCSPGHVNLNLELADGCEYECTFRGLDVCNGQDDDCDGQTDEGIDKQTDANNCGTCGKVCAYNNAQPVCNAGQCQRGACNTNFHDLDGLPGTGCEYFCVPTGQEACDGVDNDCDGQTDEGFDKQTDANNCGTCGQICRFSNAAAQCVAGQCQMGACSAGYTNSNGQSQDGCEYQCVLSNGGVEICDGKDNDCDTQYDEADPQLDASCYPDDTLGCDPQAGTCLGLCKLGNWKCLGGQLNCQGAQVPRGDVCDDLDNDCDGATDEDFDKLNDPRFCGGCNADCTFANGVALCMDGFCSLGPCRNGWVDLDDDPSNGCEHPCTNTGVEVCDGEDNDCDGLIDAQDPSMTPPSNFCVQFGECGKGGGSSATYPGVQTFPECKTPAGGSRPDWICNYPSTVELAAPNQIVAQESWCDGKDNDCDSATDEHEPSLGKSCLDDGVGECQRTGTHKCVANNPAAAAFCDFGGVAAKNPTHETCDGKDNDCDGNTDESFDNPSGLGLPTCGGVACQGVRDAVVKVSAGSPAYYIYQYEASRPDATSLAQGTSKSRACSQGPRQPWTSVNFDDAQQACASAGMRLCRTGRSCGDGTVGFDEWGVACAYSRSCSDGNASTHDAVFPYGCTYQASTCNGADRSNAVVASGSLSGCATADLDTDTGGTQAVFDLSGNVSEWTEDCRGTLSGGDIHTVRGGDYLSDQYPGLPSALECTFFQFQVAETYSHPSTGFRCCSGCAPGLAECAGSCKNLGNDSANCGACGSVCPGGTSCKNGACKP